MLRTVSIAGGKPPWFSCVKFSYSRVDELLPSLIPLLSVCGKRTLIRVLRRERGSPNLDDIPSPTPMVVDCCASTSVTTRDVLALKLSSVDLRDFAADNKGQEKAERGESA